MLTQVEINGIDVTSKVINYEVERSFGDVISEVDINVVKTISGLVSLSVGQSITIYRGWTTATEEKIFSGFLEMMDPEGGKIKIVGKDKMWALVRKEVTHTYDSSIDASAGNISEIFKDLVTTFGGLTADATSVQNSGTTTVIEKFVCNHTDIMERCQALARILDWQFYYRSDTDKVYFEPRGFTSNSTVLTVGSNIIQMPKWSYDTTEMVNDLTVAGAFQEIETTESGQVGVTSGYTTASITINFTPISVKVYMDASNPPTTLKTGGLPDSTGTFDYYVDKPNKKIIPAPSTTFTTNHYAEIRYSHAIPVPVHTYNQLSIDTYGGPDKIPFKKTITFTDIRSVDDAMQRATNFLNKYSTPFVSATIRVKSVSTYGIREGDILRIVDSKSIPNVDGFFVVTRLKIRYPADFEEYVIGDKAWRLGQWQASVEERLKRILEDQIANQDIVTEIVTVDNSVSNSIEVVPRYFKIVREDTGVPSTHTIFQYQNIYTEDFADTDFKDAGNTTASWTTGGLVL